MFYLESLGIWYLGMELADQQYQMSDSILVSSIWVYLLQQVDFYKTKTTEGEQGAKIPLPMILFLSLIASTTRSLDLLSSISSLVAAG